MVRCTTRTRSRFGFGLRALLCGLGLALGPSAALQAQTVPTGVQEYYVLGWEQHVWDMMDRVQNAQGGAQFADGMNSVVTATASADNQVVYYDHWEDGPDGELANFPDVDPGLLQGSTLVIGDGNPSNGDLCEYNVNYGCPSADIVSAGDYINFNSDRGLGGGCTTPSTPEHCSVPLNPRDPDDIRFDGGDLIETSGGPLTLIHSQYPLTNFIGGSIEILSRQAVEAARSYSVPIGEDLYVANTPTEPFHYVELELVAFEDTSITVDSPGAGSVSFTLPRGEHWSSMGFINDASLPALGLTINSGTKISTTAPISGMVFTGGDGTWATRLYTLLPDILHSTDYVTTAPGDIPNAGPTTGGTPQNRPANVYLLNPDLLTSIDVQITDSSGSYTVTIPPNAMRSMDDIGAGRDIAANSTVRMTSDRNFWGVTAYDWDTNISDWGHSWLAKKFLTETYTVSFGPGNQNQPPDTSQYANPVFVAATADRTRVQFDLDNDGAFDPVDLDGNGTADAAPYSDNTYEVDMLSALKVIDPTDNDMTGARIIANKPVAVSWGQDTDRSYYSDQALDTGFTVYPVNQLFLDPALTIDKEVDTTAVPTTSADPADRTVTYTLTVRSYGFGPLADVEVWDLLPAGVSADADYLAGSTLITCPDLVQGTVDPSFDQCTGGVSCRQLTWDIEGACGVGFTLGTDNTLTVSYQVVIPESAGAPRLLTNTGRAQATLSGSVFSPSDTAKVVQTDVTLTKAVDVTTPAAGDVVTFTLQVANTSTSVDETDVFISDPIPFDTTFVPGSITADGVFAGSGVFDAAQNAVVWNAATLPWGASATLGFQVVVNPTTPAGTEIPNRGGYESAETPYFLSNLVEPVVQGPALTAVKSILDSPSFVHPSETVTFEIRIDNTGTAAATDLLLRDPFPGNAAYLAGSLSWSLNSGPFVPLSDANDGDEGAGADGRALADRVEFRLASLGASQDLRLRFRVVVDPGTAGEVLANQGLYSANESATADTNLVQVPIVGTAVINGHVFLDLDGDGLEDPGEPPIPGVDVVISSVVRPSYTCAPGTAIPDNGYDGSQGSMACCTLDVPAGDFGAAPLITDLNVSIAATHTWVGDMTIKVFGPGGQVLALLNRPGSNVADDGTDTPYGYASNWTGADVTFDDQGGGPSAETLGSVGTDICSGDGICSYLPGPDTAGGLPDLAGLNGSDPRGSWSVCMGDSAAGDFGTFVSATLSVLTDDAAMTTHIVTTDANGDYTAVVTGVAATVDVDESDPDFPPGAVLTTANDPQDIVTVPGGSVTAPDTGYQQPSLVFTKTSDAVGNEVSPGQTVTYTMTITNNSLQTLTGIDLEDPLPTGTTYVPGSTQVTGPGSSALRVTEYFLGVGAFTGTSYDLTLDQDLAADYFVILEGSAGDGTANNDRGPNANYAALTRDPFATGELAASGASDLLRLERGVAQDSWVGVVKVVECLSDCDTQGFRLRDVLRVTHTGNTTAGSVGAVTGWSDIDQVLLMGGFNGAGCTTADAQARDTKVCHTRIFPSGNQQINWTRDAGGAVLSAATSTVMVVEWGGTWTVQRVRVQGDNGGNGINAAGEYNTAGISPVARANTWVWGTGHTNDNGVGDAAEGCAITLGNGVAQNATESLVAVGLEYGGNAVDFEVYALTHPELAVGYAFKPDGDATSLTVDVAVATAGPERMALVTNGQGDTNTTYPRPMLSSRFVADDSVRLERRRSGLAFPGWVQGVDFSALYSTPAAGGGGAPPDLVVPADGYSIPPGGTLIVSFQVLVDDPLAGGITEITNAATLRTAEQPGPFEATVTDRVVRAGVVIEYDNAGFDLPGSTVSYAHVVQNTGEGDDSFGITLSSRAGWAVELVDPASGAVIAADAGGDGVWDGGVMVNTGTLAPGASREYLLRVAIPVGAAAGAAESTALRATSDRNPGRFDTATDETVAVDALEPVIVLPDNSGVASAGGTAVYAHWVVNNTGAAAAFDLTAARELSAPVWPTAFYWDANGDGVYSAGVDIQIANTRQLADGERQRVFVVVSVPDTVTDFSTDVVHLTASLPSDPDNVFGTATDTTTVRPPLILDLSGGGTRTVDAGDRADYPGVLRNFTNVADVYDFELTESWFFGFDGLLHPTELWIDTGGDGVADAFVARDANGDGSWDAIEPGYNTDSDGRPDAAVGSGASLAYELRRPVDPGQGSSRDPVTLTAISRNSSEEESERERDSVTATLLLAAATRAVLADFDAYSVGGRVVVEWRTAVEMGTLGFDLLRLDPAGVPQRVNRSPIPGLLTALQGGTYRVLDPGAAPGERVEYLLEERDAQGGGSSFGPFAITIGERRSGLKAAEALASGSSRTANRSRVRGPRHAAATKSEAPGEPSGLAKAMVRDRGLVWLSAAELGAVLGLAEGQAVERIVNGDVWISRSGAGQSAGDAIFSDGFESGDTVRWGGDIKDPVERSSVAWAAAAYGGGLYFYGEGIDSPFTDRNVYWLGPGPGSRMAWRAAAPNGAPAESSFAERLHFEKDLWPLTSVITNPEGDVWMWEYFFSNTPGFDVKSLTLPVPGVAATASEAELTIFLQGASLDPVTPNHNLEVRLNGAQLGGTWSWHGNEAYELRAIFPQSLLAEGDNVLEVTALAAPGLDYDVVYLDAVELTYRRLYRAHDDRLEAVAAAGGTVTVDGFSSPEISVFDLQSPLAPVLLDGILIEPAEGGFTVSFEASPGMRFLATTAEAASAPAAVVADRASNLADPANRGRWVVVAGPGLEGEAEAFAAYREAQGLSAVVAPVEDVYDEFSAGVVTPWAIRDFLRHAVASWEEPPEFVFLAGDGSIDYKNLDGLGECLVPAPFISTPDGLVPSDNLLADFNGDDGVPEIAIGRLPVQAPDELATYRLKVGAFEAADGGWKRHSLWLADDPDLGGEFGDDIEAIIEAMPASATVQRVFLDELEPAGARLETVEAMSKGAGLVEFLGHGGLDRFADEGLLTTDDVGELGNAERTPVIAALTCIVGRFDIPDYDTLAEALLLQVSGGAVAVWSPSAFSMNADARNLGRHHAAALANGMHNSVGAGIRAALAAYLEAAAGDLDLPRKFILLGDPATRVDW